MRRIAIAAAATLTTITLLGAATRLPSPDAAAPGTAALDVATLDAAALDDATIVAIFDAANTADMETGALAAERGGSKAVRDFGAMLMRDHEHVRQLGRDLAKKLAVTPTPPEDDAAAREHAAAMARLRSLRGAEFDRAFLQHEVAFHRAVLEAMRGTLLPAIQNAELKALVTQVAPAFEGHMVAADAQLQKLGR